MKNKITIELVVPEKSKVTVELITKMLNLKFKTGEDFEQRMYVYGFF